MSNWKSNRLHVLRAERRWSQRHVADQLGMSQATYSNIEVGYRPPSEIEQLRIAKVFGVSVDELITPDRRATA